MKEILCIIPARGGSKSIPYKNLHLLNGKPLIDYTIDYISNINKINRIIVSTDDAIIAEHCRSKNVEVPFIRPKKYSGDKAPDLPVFQHALKWLKQNENYVPDIIVHLRPTSPIRHVRHLNKMLRIIIDDGNIDSVRSVSIANESPYKMWEKKGDFIVPFIKHEFHENYLTAKQFLPKIFFHNGNLDVIRKNTILEKNSLTGDNVYPFLMRNPKYSIQIDSLFDVKIAEYILEDK